LIHVQSNSRFCGFQREVKARRAGKHQKCQKKRRKDHSDQDPNANEKKQSSVKTDISGIGDGAWQEKEQKSMKYPPVYQKMQRNNEHMVWVFGYLSFCEQSEKRNEKT
jgi:hypothetical protein